MKFSLIEFLKLNTSLRRLWLFSMILPLAIVYTLLGVIAVSSLYYGSEKRIKDYRESLLEERKEGVKSIVTLLARAIEGMSQQQAIETVRKLQDDTHSSFLVYDGSNTILHDPDVRLGGKNVGDLKDAGGTTYLRDLAGLIADKGEGFLLHTTKETDGQEEPKLIYGRLFKKWNWVVAADVGTRDIEQKVVKQRTRIYKDVELLIARTLLISMTAIVIIFLLLKRHADRFMTRPVTSFVTTLRDAQNDLTVRVPVKERNEFGEIAKLFNTYMENLLVIMKKVADSALDINVHANDISGAVQQQASVTTEQSTAVTEITSTMEELSASSSQIAEYSKSVVDNAKKTCDDLKTGADAVNAVITKMTEISKDNEQSIREIHELGKRSKEITKIMEIINNIADQTKLIAFNAALEASSAGEAGKRFAVVAVEIRKLADNVMESTGEIEAKINEIQEAIERLVITSEKGSKAIGGGIEYSGHTNELLIEIIDAANQTTDSAKQISLSTQQQKTASSQVLTALKEIMTGSKQNTDAINQITLISKNMALLSDNLREAVEKFKLQ
jgi:methyl-accepting chemotaxis protein